MIKVMHLFRNIADQKGIPMIPFFIPLYLNKVGNYENIIITTRDKFLPELGDSMPPIEHIPIKSGGNFFPNWKFIKRIISYSPDVLIIYHHFGWPFVSLLLPLCKVLGIKTIAQADVGEWTIPRYHKSLIRTIIDFFRYIMIYTQLIMLDKLSYMTIYQFKVLSKIKQIPSDKGKVIPNISKFDIGTSKKEKYLFALSRDWTYGENLRLILEVFHKVIRQEDCKLIVAGRFRKDEKAYRQEIFSLVKKLGLKNSVKFVGRVSEESKEKLFKKAKILYLPSPCESFGMVFVEAMAYGTPIVAMKNTAVQYVVREGVTGFLRNTEQGQKEAILRLLRDKNLYREMQENCLKEAEKYKWENTIKKWNDLIQLTLGKRR